MKNLRFVARQLGRPLLNAAFSQTTKRQGGSLFTWGKNIPSLGYVTKELGVSRPQLIRGFKNNVISAAMGPSHSALLTTDGKMYTWGLGSYGVLGHNDNKNYTEPKLIEFFPKNNLRVTQIAVGDSHTAALTHDGDVWTWGWGGRKQSFLMNLLFQRIGALGHGDTKTRFTPTPVEELRKYPPVKRITTGLHFMNVLNNENQLFNWGKGDYGAFGDGNNKSRSKPILNTYFQNYLKKQLGLEVKKIKSCNNYTIALMSDKKLYGWGSNEAGQMGTKSEMGIEIYETATFPTPVKMPNEKADILNFWVGENISAFLLDNNKVYWSGIRMAYQPEKLQLPDGISKITSVGVCHNCIAVVTEEGNVYFKNNFADAHIEDLSTGIKSTTVERLFNGGKLLAIGGKYKNRWAIVKQ